MSLLKSWMLLLLVISPLTAHALFVEPDPERTAAISDVFGIRVAHGIADLSPERFKGASEYALALAQKVKNHVMTEQEARDKLFEALQNLDKGIPVADLPNPEFEVVGLMPVGESVANRDVPGVFIAYGTPPADQIKDRFRESALSATKKEESPQLQADDVQLDAAPVAEQTVEPTVEPVAAPAVAEGATTELAPAPSEDSPSHDDDAALDDRSVSSIGG